LHGFSPIFALFRHILLVGCLLGDLSEVTEEVCKNLPILRNSYHFWELFAYFPHLFAVPQLVCGYHFKPFIDIQFTEKGMPPVLSA
jgi:hypothetical protein